MEGDITHSFDPAYYGGALYDINVYNIHYCVGLFGEPKDVTSDPNTSIQMVSILWNFGSAYTMVSVLYVLEAKILTAQDMFPFKANKAL
ncbi:MAG: hypothetical protein ACLTS6_14925 [Anaerobutyricum sp.]